MTDINLSAPNQNELIDTTPDHLPFEPNDYLSELDGFDLTDDQKHALLRTLWDMMVMFADLGMGIDPTQLACGQNAKSQDHGALQGENDLKSTFNHNAL